MAEIKRFLKNETVLVISALLAAASAFAVPPSAAYFGYIDFKTLALLFCLMLVMAGFNAQGVFRLLASRLLTKTKTVRSLTAALALLCFFSSMLITNDVALITFVPFSVVALSMSGKSDKLIFVIALETVAANLGSMLTPIGNPQNLYLFSFFSMELGEFFGTVLPYGLLSLVIVFAAAMLCGKEKITLTETENVPTPSKRKCVLFACLFVLALLTVFRVVPYGITLAVTLACFLAFDRQTVPNVDYSLLLTFVFLFVFIGNLGNIPAVSSWLSGIIAGREVTVGVAASQVFSNVPAAILLSGFTTDAQALLVGVNLGGLGTVIASMASLISYKLAMKQGVKTAHYMAVFALLNVLFLAASLCLYAFIK